MTDQTIRIGDLVRLTDGREGQVWIDPAEDAWQIVVATGTEYLTVRRTDVEAVDHVLPEHRTPVDQTAKLVKARKPHHCGCETGHYAEGHRCIGIKPGQRYVRSVLFPGDINSSGKPWVMKLCLACARQYDNTDPARLAVAS